MGPAGQDSAMWFYLARSSKERKGPVATQDLMDLIHGGVIDHDTFVWTSGMAGWARLRALPAAGPRSPAPSMAMGGGPLLSVSGGVVSSGAGRASRVPMMDEGSREGPLMGDWYFVEQGAAKGPVGLQGLADLMHEGRLHGKSLVWTDSMASYMPLADALASMTVLEGREGAALPTSPGAGGGWGASSPLSTGAAGALEAGGWEGIPTPARWLLSGGTHPVMPVEEYIRQEASSRQEVVGSAGRTGGSSRRLALSPRGRLDGGPGSMVEGEERRERAPGRVEAVAAVASTLRMAVRAEAEAQVERARTEARLWERKARESATAAALAEEQRRGAERRLEEEQERSHALEAELAELRSARAGEKGGGGGGGGGPTGDELARWVGAQRAAWASRGLPPDPRDARGGAPHIN